MYFYVETGIIMNKKNKFLRLFFPYRCELCGEIIPIEKDYCDCYKMKITRVSEDFCEHCGRETKKCVCSEKEIKLPHITAPFVYRGFIEKYIIAYKFHGKKHFHKKLGIEMANRFSACYPSVNADMVTFVSVSQKTLFLRGYNQSELLAKAVAENLSLPLVPLFVKTKETKSQSHLTAKERATNLNNAISLIDNADIEGKTIILCDDVKTTGNTFNICVKLLTDAGASDVYCLSAAISDYEKLPF